MPPTITAPSGATNLARADSRTSITSIHTRNALRRMATHETGTGIERDYDGRHTDPASSTTATAAAGPSRTRREMEMEMHDEAHEHDLVVTPVPSRRLSEGARRGSRRAGHTKEDGDEHEKDIAGSSEEGHDEPGRDQSGARQGQGGAGVPRDGKGEFVLQDQTNLLPVKQILIIFSGLSMAMICAMLDQTTVTTALPTLGQVFNRADIPMYGRLSDIFGRKPCLLASLVVFFIGALGCSVSQSMIMLIVFRAIEGIGGGGILTLTMIIVSDIVTLEERGKYQGIIGVVVAFSNSIGPIVGGSLTEKATWRACWWLIMPITFLAIVIIYFLLPLKRVTGSYKLKLKQVDWLGSFLTLAWAVLVLVALSWAGTQYSWSSGAVLAPLLIGIALLGVFLFVELKAVKLPLIPLYIFRDKTVSAAMAITFLSGIGFYCTLYYLPQYFQQVRGASAIRSGVLILPLTCVQTVCVFIAGFLTSKTGDYWWSLTIGFVCWSVGLGLMTTINSHTPDAHLIGYQIVLGVGAGQTFQTSLVAIQAAVERKDMATATGTRNFLRMLGGTIGLAACGTLVNNLAGKEMGKRGYEQAFVNEILKDPVGGQMGASAQAVEDIRASFGIQGVFYLLVPCIALCFFLTVLFVKKIPLKRADDAKRKEEAKEWVRERKEKHRSKRQHGSRTGAGGANEAGHADGDDWEADVEKGDRRDSARSARSGGSGEGSDDTIVDDDKERRSGQAGESGKSTQQQQDEKGHRGPHKIAHSIERGLEEAGRGAEEALGAGIPQKEGIEQGPIGTRG